MRTRCRCSRPRLLNADGSLQDHAGVSVAHAGLGENLGITSLAESPGSRRLLPLGARLEDRLILIGACFC